MRRKGTALLVGGALAAMLVAGRAGAGSYSLETEAVDDFSHQPGFGNLICDQEVGNWRSRLLNAPNTIFTSGAAWLNNGVWDTDFTDPERTGHSYDSDTYNFDQTGSFSSYFCGHGMCDDDPGSPQTCTATSQCTTPPGGSSMPAYCVGQGPGMNSPGTCFYNRNRNLIINNDATQQQNHYNGYVNYSSGATVRWGESANSGAWGGAGTNGGTNFVGMMNSCGLRPSFYWQEAANVFAGAHLMALVMPISHGSDTWSAPTRGQHMADGYVANAFSSVGVDAIDGINSIPFNDGPACPVGAPNYNNGGGHGIGGCGAQVVMSLDKDQASANWHALTESWVGMTFDTNDATASGWLAAYIVCNYDCNKYPIIL